MRRERGPLAGFTPLEALGATARRACDGGEHEGAGGDRTRGACEPRPSQARHALPPDRAVAAAARSELRGGLADPEPLAVPCRARPGTTRGTSRRTSSGRSGEFQERHYSEFVAFLPHVQRFLYGAGPAARRVRPSYGDSPIKVFRRDDIAQVRMTFAAGAAAGRVRRRARRPLLLLRHRRRDARARDLRRGPDRSTMAQDTALPVRARLPGFVGRARRGGALPLPRRVAFAPTATVLADSDYERREKYLAFVCRHRAPRIASHWAFLLAAARAAPHRREGARSASARSSTTACRSWPISRWTT